MTTLDPILFEDELFRVEQCLDPPIAGYLIVRARPLARTLAELPPAALAALGPLLARASRAIERVVAPQRIYVIRLGEEVEQIHFHLFPRTLEMAETHRRLKPESAHLPLNGAELFDWARKLARATPPQFVSTDLARVITHFARELSTDS